jgi:hypothetical protein
MIYTHSFNIALAPEHALKLFTPAGERAWAAHWDPHFPAGESGDGAVPGTVFLTGDTHWVVIDRDADRVRYARVTPGVRAGTVEVRLVADGEGTRADVTYDITAIAPDDDFDPAIHEWESAIARAI